MWVKRNTAEYVTPIIQDSGERIILNGASH